MRACQPSDAVLVYQLTVFWSETIDTSEGQQGRERVDMGRPSRENLKSGREFFLNMWRHNIYLRWGFSAALIPLLFGNSIPGHIRRAQPMQMHPAGRVGSELATDSICWCYYHCHTRNHIWNSIWWWYDSTVSNAKHGKTCNSLVLASGAMRYQRRSPTIFSGGESGPQNRPIWYNTMAWG